MKLSTVWNRVLVLVAMARYGCLDVTFDGMAPPPLDHTAEAWVTGSRSGQFLMGHDQINVFWVTDGELVLPGGELRNMCHLVDYTFAFRVTYTQPTGEKGWRKHLDDFTTAGTVDVVKLRDALRLIHVKSEPLTIADLELFARRVVVGAVV